MEQTWRFEFTDNTGETTTIKDGITTKMGSGISEKSNKKEKNNKTFEGEFTKKIEENVISTYAISPLNTITGGLASPVYQGVKQVVSAVNSGASVGSAVGGVAGGVIATAVILAIQTGINHIQNRLSTLETQVKDLNNTDNVLIRAGAVSKVTNYSYNIFGIKKTTNRS